MDLIAVTDRKQCQGDFLQQLRRLSDSGVAAVLLREKDLTKVAYGQLAAQCQHILQACGVPLIINSQIAVARALGISQVQVPFPLFAKQHGCLNDFAQVLVSVHSLEEATHAAQWGADGLVAGHIFATNCKVGLPPRGLAFLDAICTAVSIPVYAIGGIDADTWPLIQQSHAAGACVMRAAMAEHFFWVP